MKANIRLFFRAYQAQGNVQSKLDKLTWSQRGQRESLENKLNHLNNRIETLTLTITREDFISELRSMMCCTWADFSNTDELDGDEN